MPPSCTDQSTATERSSESGRGSTPLRRRCPGSTCGGAPRLLVNAGIASAWNLAVRAGVISADAFACPMRTVPTRPSLRCARTLPVGRSTEPPPSPETKSVPAMFGSGGGGGGGAPEEAEAAEAMWWMIGARRCAGRSMTANAAFCNSPKRFPSIFTTAPSERSSTRRS